MTRVEGGRLCAECQTVVHDLSSMSEREARALLASGAGERLCVRYLYDASGRIAFAGEQSPAAQIVPAYKLSQRAKARIAQAALLAAPLVLFEACGGAYGDPLPQNWEQRDAGDAAADAQDAGNRSDAGDAGRRGDAEDAGNGGDADDGGNGNDLGDGGAS